MCLCMYNVIYVFYLLWDFGLEQKNCDFCALLCIQASSNCPLRL